ncbi:chorismate-binding protein [Candidatus Vidania fulgoroideorum]
MSFAVLNCFEFYIFCLRSLFFSSVFSLVVINNCYSYCVTITYSIIAICWQFVSGVTISYFACITIFNYHYFDFFAKYGGSFKLSLSPFVLLFYKSNYIYIYIFSIVTLCSRLLVLKLLYSVLSYCWLFTGFFYKLLTNPFKLVYVSNFYSVKADIFAGNLIQCQLSKFNYLKSNIEPVLLFLLCSTYDLCFSFAVMFLRNSVVSFTPEIMCVLSSSYVFLYPIAGTICRGNDIFSDKFLSKNLLTNNKELAEHLMLVDLSRNDLGCFVASYECVFTFRLVSFYYVHHIISCVVANYWRLAAFDTVIRCISPIGTLAGAPKLVALRFIAQQEIARGMYAGAIGIQDLCSRISVYFALIRTIVFCECYCIIRSASGVVLGSFIKNEYFELNNKLRVFLKG